MHVLIESWWFLNFVLLLLFDAIGISSLYFGSFSNIKCFLCRPSQWKLDKKTNALSHFNGFSHLLVANQLVRWKTKEEKKKPYTNKQSFSLVKVLCTTRNKRRCTVTAAGKRTMTHANENCIPLRTIYLMEDFSGVVKRNSACPKLISSLDRIIFCLAALFLIHH